MEKIKLDLGPRSYNIIIEEDVLDKTEKYLSKLKLGKKIFIVTDKNIPKKYLRTLKNSLTDKYEIHEFILKPGEHLKSFLNLVKITNKILKQKPDRNSTIIALGGGVIGDLSGFIASIILRGINFIQIPTTLLSQVDSSVGGKTGINTVSGKNLVGSFYQPRIVLIDPKITAHLPEREFLCGYVETFKYALINDKKFYDFLEKNKQKIKKRELSALTQIIKTACLSKAKIVALDEQEKSGSRALLNLGHTFGHALEKELRFKDKLKHGEAVAIGIVLAAKFSNKLGFLDKQKIKKIEDHFNFFSIPIDARKFSKKWDSEQLVENMKSDKKAEDGNLVFILMSDIGKSFIARNIDSHNVLDFLRSTI